MNKLKTMNESSFLKLFMGVMSAAFVIAAFLMPDRANAFSGLWQIMSQPGKITTNYFHLGGYAATFLNMGLVAMYAVAKLIHASRRLTENGTLDVRNAIGESAKVYIPIPEQGRGEGKVTLYLQGRYAECEAVTMGPEMLKTGSTVRVVDARNGVLVVEAEEE